MTAHAQAFSKPSAPPPTHTTAKSGILQRQCACGGAGSLKSECRDCANPKATLQRNVSSHHEDNSFAPPIVNEVLRAEGQPLNASVRNLMESHFGHDFSRIRVHTDARAAQSAREVDASAYTVGQHVVFDTGRYAPTTNEGVKLLTHELTHVVEKAPGLARDQDPTERPEAGIIPAPPLETGASDALKFSPRLREHVPRAPQGGWRMRVLQANNEQGARRMQAFLDLINEALAPDAALYPDLKLPVKFFKSNAAATHGEVSLDTTRSEVPGGVGLYADTRPRDNELTTPPRIFIVLTPAALDPDDQPFTQKVLAHEYVHFKQKLNRELMVRPDCPVNWRGSPLGGNPNREVRAIKATFTRFFPAWADTVTTEPKEFPRHIIQDLKFLQAYFPCVEPDIQTDVVSSIAATANGKPTRHRLLLQMVQAVRSEALPSLAVSESNNGMARLAKALGAPLSRDERLPGPPTRPTFEPLFDINAFKARGSERIGQQIQELEP